MQILISSDINLIKELKISYLKSLKDIILKNIASDEAKLLNNHFHNLAVLKDEFQYWNVDFNTIEDYSVYICSMVIINIDLLIDYIEQDIIEGKLFEFREKKMIVKKIHNNPIYYDIETIIMNVYNLETYFNKLKKVGDDIFLLLNQLSPRRESEKKEREKIIIKYWFHL